MKTRVLLAILLVSTFSIATSQQIGLRLPDDAAYSAIPFETHNGLIVIPVILNGRAQVKFIVDSSVEHTLLTSKAIGDDVGFSYIRKMSLGTAADGSELVAHAANQLNLTLGDGIFSGDNHSMMVLEYDFIGLQTIAETTVHGLIGKDVFNSFVVQPDFKARMLVLHNPDSFKIPNGYEAVPLKFEGGRPYISVETVFENWDELSEFMQVKTGAPHTLLYDSPNNLFHIPPKKIETILGVSSEGPWMGYVGRMREVKIGSYAFESPIGSFTHEQKKGENRGSIGMGMLSRFDWIMDYPGATLYLRPNSNFSNTFEYDMSGFKVDKVGEGYEVSYVQENSPAASAGLEIGDKLLAINDLPLTIKNYQEAAAVFKDKPNKNVTLRINRRGQEKEISYKLVRFL